MKRPPLRPGMAIILFGFALLFGALFLGLRAMQRPNPAYFSVSNGEATSVKTAPTSQAAEQGFATPNRLVNTPTPDNPHPLPGQRTQVDQYIVQAGDSLGKIGQRYAVSLEQLARENHLVDINVLEVGQVLTIPLPDPASLGPDFKIIPDVELVYGPTTTGFNIKTFVTSQSGYLKKHQEEVEGRMLSGADIVQRVVQDFSVNPRLLMAVLEYQSGWLSNPNPRQKGLDYPLGLVNQARKGLYSQLVFAANNLNRGFYLWRVNGVGAWLLADGNVVPIHPQINAGTAGVQQFFALLTDRATWDQAVGENGLINTYTELFGSPFLYSYEPLIPQGLQQPPMQLPFEPGRVWSFTGGPHGGWADGSAWAALDFAPPGEGLGCIESEDWVTAVADGLILRAADGVIIQDLDGDGLEGTGWVVLYLHIATRERIQVGVSVQSGERIGHPSCEGGVSDGTHVHLARRYNGEWIPADRELPFNLDGWISSGAGREYDGYLQSEGKTIEAYAGNAPINEIQR